MSSFDKPARSASVLSAGAAFSSDLILSQMPVIGVNCCSTVQHLYLQLTLDNRLNRDARRTRASRTRRPKSVSMPHCEKKYRWVDALSTGNQPAPAEGREDNSPMRRAYKGGRPP